MIGLRLHGSDADVKSYILRRHMHSVNRFLGGNIGWSEERKNGSETQLLFVDIEISCVELQINIAERARGVGGGVSSRYLLPYLGSGSVFQPCFVEWLVGGESYRGPRYGGTARSEPLIALAIIMEGISKPKLQLKQHLRILGFK